MKHLLFSCLAVWALTSCHETKKAANTNDMTTNENAGYTSLFDGQTLAGWRTYQNKPADSWTVKDGALYCKGSATDKSDRRADLITAGQYENFDLSLDWKISPQGNSGIMYLVTEEFPAAYLSGPEYQVIDDLNFPEKLEDWQRTAANYAMDAAPAAKPRPAGEWKQKKATGKWKDAAGYGLSKKGHIALQDHGSEAWFKNIKIREL